MPHSTIARVLGYSRSQNSLGYDVGKPRRGYALGLPTQNDGLIRVYRIRCLIENRQVFRLLAL